MQAAHQRRRVWLETIMPTQKVYSDPGTPASTVVGTCGKVGARVAVLTARA